MAAGVALLSVFGDTAGRLTAVGVCMYGWQWFFRCFYWMERWIVETAGSLRHVYLSPNQLQGNVLLILADRSARSSGA